TLLADNVIRGTEILITFDLPLTAKLPLEESLALVAKQGSHRLLMEGQTARLDEALARVTGGQAPGAGRRSPLASLTVIQDRLKATDASRARFIEACEQAYHFGKG